MDKEKIAEVLTMEKFREWAKIIGDDVLMKINHPEMCPIAIYLKQFEDGLHVYPTGITSTHGYPEIELPRWAEEFIYEVDNSGLGTRRITYEEVMAALDYVQERVNMLTKGREE